MDVVLVLDVCVHSFNSVVSYTSRIRAWAPEVTAREAITVHMVLGKIKTMRLIKLKSFKKKKQFLSPMDGVRLAGNMVGFGCAALIFGTILSIIRHHTTSTQVMLNAAIAAGLVLVVLSAKLFIRQKTVDDVS